ncbi:MAG: hypothetical protein HY420_04355 [Candidatus Kerfeldbacteria bacterium]|nr:hypothetical protein [Candidatus Kerfeldbacteria bacterium]
MEFFGFIGIASPVIIIGIIVFFVIALVQEGKTAGRGEAVKGAFLHAVSLVMLAFIVVAVIYLLQLGLRSWVFTKAQDPYQFVSPPPTLYLSSDKATTGPVLYACTEKCEFSEVDKEQLKSWKESYLQWKKDQAGTSSLTLSRKRNLVNALSFFIVALPLYWWFFLGMLQKEAKKAREQNQKPGPLRSVYFYLVAFSGLIGVVVSAALLVNTGLNAVLKIDTDKTVAIRQPAPFSPAGLSTENYGVKSVVKCADKCSFTTEDKQLAEAWLTDYEQWQKNNVSSFPPQSSSQTSLASNIPILIVTLPLFLLHFLRIRRESAGTAPGAPNTTSGAS